MTVPAGTGLYGGGKVIGPLLRNGQKTKMWNTDNGMYRVDNGTRLYQTHPWVLGVRPDRTAFGVLFDSFWKAELKDGRNMTVNMVGSEGSGQVDLGGVKVEVFIKGTCAEGW